MSGITYNEVPGIIQATDGLMGVQRLLKNIGLVNSAKALDSYEFRRNGKTSLTEGSFGNGQVRVDLYVTGMEPTIRRGLIDIVTACISTDDSAFRPGSLTKISRLIDLIEEYNKKTDKR